MYDPQRELAVDEAMVRYKGFRGSVQKFFMPCKPIRAGYKIYLIAKSATGYILKFIVHGMGTHKLQEIVLELCGEERLGKYHHVFTDKLYTSVALARSLFSKKTYFTGSVKKNGKDLPADFKQPGFLENLKKTQRGTFYARQFGQLTCTVWNDSSIVETLSSYYDGFRNKAKDFVDRHYSADGQTARKHQVSVLQPPLATISLWEEWTGRTSSVPTTLVHGKVRSGGYSCSIFCWIFLE